MSRFFADGHVGHAVTCQKILHLLKEKENILAYKNSSMVSLLYLSQQSYSVYFQPIHIFQVLEMFIAIPMAEFLSAF